MERRRRATVRFKAGHIPSWRGPCECYALPLGAVVSQWLLLLLSPLLSAVGERLVPFPISAVSRLTTA